jgi:hypothetical protein
VVRHSREGARKLPGLYVRHQAACPAYLPADTSRKCRCTPYFKPRYASKWGQTFRDEGAEMLHDWMFDAATDDDAPSCRRHSTASARS